MEYVIGGVIEIVQLVCFGEYHGGFVRIESYSSLGGRRLGIVSHQHLVLQTGVCQTGVRWKVIVLNQQFFRQMRIFP